jgi:hypothetical protein
MQERLTVFLRVTDIIAGRIKRAFGMTKKL